MRGRNIAFYGGPFLWFIALLKGILLSRAPVLHELQRMAILPSQGNHSASRVAVNFSIALFASFSHALIHPPGMERLAIFRGLFTPWHFA